MQNGVLSDLKKQNHHIGNMENLLQVQRFLWLVYLLINYIKRIKQLTPLTHLYQKYKENARSLNKLTERFYKLTDHNRYVIDKGLYESRYKVKSRLLSHGKRERISSPSG